MPHYIIETRPATGRKNCLGRGIREKYAAVRKLAAMGDRGKIVAIETHPTMAAMEAAIAAHNEHLPVSAPTKAASKKKDKAAPTDPVVRPPSDRGQGRKALQAGAESLVVPIRMTAGQKAKLQALGGAQWIRECIERAKVAA